MIFIQNLQVSLYKKYIINTRKSIDFYALFYYDEILEIRKHISLCFWGPFFK